MIKEKVLKSETSKGKTIKLVSIIISIIIILLLLILFLFSKKEVNFQKVMEKNNFVVTDIGVNSYVAVNDHFIVTYNVFKNHKEAVKTVKKVTKGVKNIDINKKNNITYYIFANKYIYSEYVIDNNKFIYSSAPRKYMSEVIDSFKFLNY